MEWQAGHVLRAHDDLGPFDAWYRIEADGRVIARLSAEAAHALGAALFHANQEQPTAVVRYSVSARRGSRDLVLESRAAARPDGGPAEAVNIVVAPDETGMYEIGHQLWSWRAVACTSMHVPGTTRFFTPRVAEEFESYNLKADHPELGRNTLAPLMLAWETVSGLAAPLPGRADHPDARSVARTAAEVIADQLDYCRTLGFDVVAMLAMVLEQDAMVDAIGSAVTDSAELAEAIGAAAPPATDDQIAAVVAALGYGQDDEGFVPWEVGAIADLQDVIAHANNAGVAWTTGVTVWDTTDPDSADCVITVDLPGASGVRLATLTVALKHLRTPDGLSSAEAVRAALERVKAERDREIEALSAYINACIRPELLLSAASKH